MKSNSELKNISVDDIISRLDGAIEGVNASKNPKGRKYWNSLRRELEAELANRGYSQIDIEDALSHYNTELDKQNADAEQPWIMPSRTNLKSRIMYIECKEGEENGVANIGRVFFSKTGKTIYYDNKKFHSSKGRGIYGNYRDVDTGDEYWISGPKKDRNDRLFGGQKDVIIDNDIADEYFQLISK